MRKQNRVCEPAPGRRAVECHGRWPDIGRIDRADGHVCQINLHRRHHVGCTDVVSPMKIDLTDVTVCAVDSANVRPAAMALNRSAARCRFADSVLFSHEPASGSFRTIRTDKIESTTAYSHFVFKRLPMVIETPFVLVVQWDGFVIDPVSYTHLTLPTNREV